MNGLSSQCSSRCESGWTMYLDHTVSQNHGKRSGFVNEGNFFNEKHNAMEEAEEPEGATDEEEEEDLSMVSDASSGPPHFHEDEEYCEENGCSCFTSSAPALAKKNSKRQKIKDQDQQQQYNPSLLDDTASSPIFSFSNVSSRKGDNSRDKNKTCKSFSQGRSSFQKNFGFLDSSLPGPKFTKPSGLQGRKWE